MTTYTKQTQIGRGGETTILSAAEIPFDAQWYIQESTMDIDGTRKFVLYASREDERVWLISDAQHAPITEIQVTQSVGDSATVYAVYHVLDHRFMELQKSGVIYGSPQYSQPGGSDLYRPFDAKPTHADPRTIFFPKSKDFSEFKDELYRPPESGQLFLMGH